MFKRLGCIANSAEISCAMLIRTHVQSCLAFLDIRGKSDVACRRVAAR